MGRLRPAIGRLRVRTELQARLSGLSIEELRARARGRPATASAGPRALRRDGPLPLSFGQERLWFTQQLDPASAAYHLVYALRLRGSLDLDALTGAFVDIQQRHEVLRTRFDADDGVPMQRILDTGAFRLERAAVDGASEAARCAALRQVILVEQQRPFDLAREDPLRAVLIRESEQAHVLLIIVHHIAADGWSLNIILNEIIEFYNARMRGECCTLPALQLQFADYALWQRQSASAAQFASQLEFWERTLSRSEHLRLPFDRPRPSIMSDRGDREPFWLSERVSAALTTLARRQGVTPFMVLLASYLVLLARYSGQHDLCVGTVISGRSDVRVEPLVGFFLNSLVIRVDLSGDPSLGELLQRVKTAATQAYAHQEVPFERVVKVLRPDRILAGQPLFQTSFTLTDAPAAATAMHGLEVTRISDERVTTQSDLALSMQSDHGRFAGIFEYSTDLFDKATIERMRDHFVRLVEAAVDAPEVPIASLPLLAPEERRLLLQDWAATENDETAYARPVADLIREQAACTPTATAVADGQGSIDYAELDRRSDLLAQRLIRLGLQPDDLVAIYLKRGIDLVVAIVGVLKAGCAYLPLDPSLFSERTLIVLKEAGPRAMVAPEGALEAGIPIVSIDDLGLRPNDRADHPHCLAPAVGPDHLAYVIYTSGSTGTPKGAGVNQAGVANLARWYVEAAQMGTGGRNLVVTSSAFDLTQVSLVAPLTAGGCVELAPEPFDPVEICHQIARSGVTVLNLTPSALYVIADAAIEGGIDVSSLRYVLVGGEVLNLERLRPLGRRYPHLALANGYGPTECSDLVTVHTLEDGWSEDARMPVPIGRPIANTRCYVLDPRGEPVPIGVVGEIFIGGICVGRGYLGRPELTRERFLADPFAGEPHARMYRTGDLGRWRGDGNLDFVDRADRQVKVRGFRIELADVEAELLAQAGVGEAAVIACGATGGDKRLVGYVVPAAGTMDFSLTALRAALRARLPAYMIPQRIMLLPAMPLTPNGKIDRTALPALSEEAEAEFPESAASAGARTEIERVLVETWLDVLGLTRLSIDQNPFDVGADSLLLLRVVARVAKRLGRPIAVADFFRHPTVRELAAVLERQPGDASALVAEAKADGARRLRGRATRVRGVR